MDQLENYWVFYGGFAISLLQYFFFRPKGNLPKSYLHIISKILPILFLVLQTASFYVKSQNHNGYSFYILIGLIFSCLGDVLLTKPVDQFFQFFLAILMFGIAHISYMFAFGFPPEQPQGHSIVVTVLIIISIINKSLRREMKNPMMHALILSYSLTIGFSLWRALAMEGRENLIYGKIGMILFVISDCSLSFLMFVSNVPFGYIFVMSTYYLAQFLLVQSIY